MMVVRQPHLARKADVLIHFPQLSPHPSSMLFYCNLLLEGLRARGYSVSVLSKQRLLTEAATALHTRLIARTPAILSTWPRLLQVSRKPHPPWIINISQEYVTPFSACRTINIIHDVIQLDYPRSRFVAYFYRHCLPAFARNAALNISVSNTTARLLADLGIKSRVVYNEFNIPDRAKAESAELRQRPFLACWVGTLSSHKNISEYFAAARAIPHASFAAIMPIQESSRLATVVFPPANVSIFGSLSSDDYADLLSRSRFLVSTSRVEGFGRPPGDGALAGCDLILSDIPIYRELYDGIANFYRLDNVAELISLLKRTPRDIRVPALARFREWNAEYRLIDVIDETISATYGSPAST
jgi:glycosyltransferase involved in cell wall biosynthesis